MDGLGWEIAEDESRVKDEGVDASVGSVSCGLPVGALGAGANRDAMPETTIPGCKPRKGESREIVPKMRCLKGLGR